MACLGAVPPVLVLGVMAEPPPPHIQVLLDLVLAGIVEKDRAVAKLLLVSGDAEDVRRQNERCLALVAVELADGLAPVLAAPDVALVLRDDERDTVDKEHSILAALPNAFNPVLVRGGEVRHVLPLGAEGDEPDARGWLSGPEVHPGPVAE